MENFSFLGVFEGKMEGILFAKLGENILRIYFRKKKIEFLYIFLFVYFVNIFFLFNLKGGGNDKAMEEKALNLLKANGNSYIKAKF